MYKFPHSTPTHVGTEWGNLCNIMQSIYTISHVLPLRQVADEATKLLFTLSFIKVLFEFAQAMPHWHTAQTKRTAGLSVTKDARFRCLPRAHIA